MNTISIYEIKSNEIAFAAARLGLKRIIVLAELGEGDKKITVYQIGDVRVADTNGGPVWEIADPDAFAELLEDAGIEIDP